MAGKYDLSEFAPQQKKYDLSEFAPDTTEAATPDSFLDNLKNLPQALFEVPTNFPKDVDYLRKAVPAIGNIPHAGGVVASDILDTLKGAVKAGVQAYGNIPQDIDYLKKNIPAAASLIQNDPASAGRSALAGTGELIGKISRAPPALADYLAHIGMIKPETAQAMPRSFSEAEVKNYMDQVAGTSKPGSELIRGTFRNADSVYGATKLGRILNPLNLTTRSIVNDVLNTEKNNVLTHNKMYNNLWKEADKKGFNQVPFNSAQLSPDVNFISRYYPEKSTAAVKDFMSNPTLENAQKAQSDLGQLRRSIEEKAKKTPLLETEKQLHNSLSNAENHIEGNMFKNANGDINLPLQRKYKQISSSYRENVVPYKYNPAIQNFKDKKLLAKELLQSLKRGEFAAKKGSAHRAIGLGDNLLPYLGITGSIGGTIAGGDLLINKLLNRNNSSAVGDT
jgi:hypothetical protein